MAPAPPPPPARRPGAGASTNTPPIPSPPPSSHSFPAAASHEDPSVASSSIRLHQPHGTSSLGPGGNSSVASSSIMVPYETSHHQTTGPSPLPPNVQRSLGDRNNEKRKAAAVELERLVRGLYQHQQNNNNNSTNNDLIPQIIDFLSKDYCTSMNSNYRKGGLIGLAAVAVGMVSHQNTIATHLPQLLPPVLHCFDDPEARVRYYACESLYNVIKVARVAFAQQEHFFQPVFEGLTKLYADVDVDVKNGAQVLDQLLKDIVTTETTTIPVSTILPLLQSYIQRTNPYIRQLIVGWITLLDSIPGVSMLTYLPDILEGLFSMLSDSNREIRQASQSVLAELLRQVAVTTVLPSQDLVVPILGRQCQPPSPTLHRATALQWIAAWIRRNPAVDTLEYSGLLLQCILGGLGAEEPVEIQQGAVQANAELWRVVRQAQERFALPPLLTVLEAVWLDTPRMEQQSTETAATSDVPTKLAALKWINMLLEKRPDDMEDYTQQLLPLLLKTLSDPSDVVVLLDLQVLSRISLAAPSSSSSGCSKSSSNRQKEEEKKSQQQQLQQLQLVLNAILHLFRHDRRLLETRGSLIIRKLCVLLNARTVYIRMADTLASYETADGGSSMADADTLQFISTMVQTLNLILLTAGELHGLRESLAKSFVIGNSSNDTEDDDHYVLFATLFHCWCHNPVATVSLCLLAQAYNVSFSLVQRLAQWPDIKVGLLVQLDKLVVLLESPVFVALRLQLLETNNENNSGPNPVNHEALLKSLYGILMCLPQGDSFRLLNERLTAVGNLRDQLDLPRMPTDTLEAPTKTPGGLDQDKLLYRFDSVALLHQQQDQHERHRLQQQHAAESGISNCHYYSSPYDSLPPPGGAEHDSQPEPTYYTHQQEASGSGSTRITIHRLNAPTGSSTMTASGYSKQ